MTIINNVHIYDPNHNFNEQSLYHIKIKDGRFAEINEGVFDGDARGHTLVDGKQQVLCPSFTDSHLHLLRYGLMKTELDLRQAESWSDVKQLISDDQSKRELKEGDWIVARGLMDNTYADIPGLAHADDLDEIEDERPMFVLHKDGHECVLNTPALEEVKKDDDLKAGHDEFIEKGPDGNWTGRFTDTAVHFIKFHFRSKNEDEIDKALRHAFPHLARWGITSVHPDDLNYAGNYAKVWKGYCSLEKQNKLDVRAFLHHYVFNIEDMKYFLKNSDKRTGDGTDKVRVGAFKIFVDGTHRLHTAALQEPYHDAPEDKGALIYEPEELEAMVTLAEENNMQVAMHCIGDRAVKTALDAIETAGNSMRHRIIHAQTLSDKLLERLNKVQPCVETQPGFLLDEWNRYAKWVGEKRGPYCGMVKSLQDQNVHFTLSSDAPIGPINPWKHIFAGVNRTNEDGEPEGGWVPSERIDIETAFNGYTSTPTYLEFMENEKGKVEEGAMADFIMLHDFPTNYATDELKDVIVQQTWLDGQKIFDKSENAFIE